MKPLRDLILVKQDNGYKQEMSEGGILIVSNDISAYNFKEDDIELSNDVIHSQKKTKRDLNNALIAASKKRNGTFIEFNPGGGDVDIASIETNKQLKDIIFGAKKNAGKIVSIGDEVKKFNDGDDIVFKKGCGMWDMSEIGEGYILIEEESVLAKKVGNDFLVRDDSVIIKVTKESRDKVFGRKIKRDDGLEVTLFIPKPTDSTDEKASQFYVTCGEIVKVGKNVEDARVGDIGIMNYLIDNDEGLILGYEGQDKLVVVKATTERHDKDYVVYQNQKSNRDQLVWSKGDYKEMSNLIGVIRDGNIHPVEPFVILEHKPTVVDKETIAGIFYQEDEKVVERTVLAVSKKSEKRTGVKAGKKVLIDDFDMFDIVLDGYKVSAINDIDIMCESSLLQNCKKNS